MISRMTKPQKEKLQKKLYTTVDDKKKGMICKQQAATQISLKRLCFKEWYLPKGTC